MGSAGFIGRVGALAVALGVGTAIGSPAGLAWAQPDGSAAADTSPAGDAGTASDAAATSGGDTGTPPASGVATADSTVAVSSSAQPTSEGGITVAVGDAPAVVIVAQTNASATPTDPALEVAGSNELSGGQGVGTQAASGVIEIQPDEAD